MYNSSLFDTNNIIELMTPESSLLSNGSVNTIPAETNVRNNRRAVFSVVSAALVAAQICGKHISVPINMQQ
jgi:hypothetical protein